MFFQVRCVFIIMYLPFFSLLQLLPSLSYFYLSFSTSTSSILPLPSPILPPTLILSPPPHLLPSELSQLMLGEDTLHEGQQGNMAPSKPKEMSNIEQEIQV